MKINTYNQLDTFIAIIPPFAIKKAKKTKDILDKKSFVISISADGIGYNFNE